MIFEEYLSKWIAAKTGRAVKGKITPKSIIVAPTGDNYESIDSNTCKGSMYVMVTDDFAGDAAELSTALSKTLLEDLPAEKYIRSTSISNVSRDVEGIPTDGWIYALILEYHTSYRGNTWSL